MKNVHTIGVVLKKVYKQCQHDEIFTRKHSKTVLPHFSNK